MTVALPESALDTLEWGWEQWQPAFAALNEAPLNAANVADWLAEWSRLARLLSESYSRLQVATSVNTADEAAEARFRAFLAGVLPQAMTADQELKRKLLESGVEPPDFAVPMRDLRAEAELFREANLPLQTEERMLFNEYNKLMGAQTISWDGQELPLPQLVPLLQSTDRSVREQAWRLGSERQLADREAVNRIWVQLLGLRRQQAANAGESDYRAYAWRMRKRFDYSPDDCLRFHEAIEAAVVPAAARVYARKAKSLGLERLRPWDVDGEAPGVAPLRPFSDADELIARGEAVFQRVDGELGDYFATMRHEGLLDLASRKNKAPGGFCATFANVGRPYIFMNAVGTASDVRTLLHEAGHAFHAFAASSLPYHQQQDYPTEFAEVASMAMELLAAPYLRRDDGGYYAGADYARARVEHLEDILTFWPYMAVVDGFQHWAYTNPDEATDPAACDNAWGRLWERFMAGIDWSGLDDARVTGWHRKLHIYGYPFYYVEYGIAQLGAVQVWRNALSDQSAALAAYRRALALGGTATLPELFAAANVRFAFDTATVREAVALIEEQISALSA